MDYSKIVVVSLVLAAAIVALPYLQPSKTVVGKDFITTEAVKAIHLQTKSDAKPLEHAINALTSKTLISSDVLNEALLLNNDKNGLIPCGESCAWFPFCFTETIGCSCQNKICYFM
uniref:Cyclotide n=1 Tax=Viola tricolor TaxID=214053 RepID=A0A0N9XU39_9ROSI|nr:cyclotide precursor [Viola tricolor]